MLSAKREEVRNVFHVTNSKYMLSRVSKTFHGRDIFSCIAAHVLEGVPPYKLGKKINDYVVIKIANSKHKKNKVFGEVIHIDGFGNIITNISRKDLKKAGIIEGSTLQTKLNEKSLKLRFCSFYNEVPLRTPLAIISSTDFLEIAINQGNASKTYNTRIADPICLSREYN
jgi:S-adenosylmethionine hydrolase